MTDYLQEKVWGLPKIELEDLLDRVKLLIGQEKATLTLNYFIELTHGPFTTGIFLSHSFQYRTVFQHAGLTIEEIQRILEEVIIISGPEVVPVINSVATALLILWTESKNTLTVTWSCEKGISWIH
jgi:hypothetical protein